jgi:hypothetical protein
MKMISSQFEDNGFLPNKYSCDGEGVSPLLQIIEIPKNAKALALVVSDPDALSGDFIHWLLTDFKPTAEILEGLMPKGAIRGSNSSGLLDYVPACPPSGSHRYVFTLYALSEILGLREGFTKEEFEQKAGPKTLEKATLVGLYERTK